MNRPLELGMALETHLHVMHPVLTLTMGPRILAFRNGSIRDFGKLQ